jgi:hypothetical protein
LLSDPEIMFLDLIVKTLVPLNDPEQLFSRVPAI